jgi:hypothetical protein
MKTLILLTLATLLTGCAAPNGQQFMQKFGEGMQYQSQYMQQNQRAYTPVTQARLDNQCFQNCTQQGYQYGLCQSKCTY